MEVIMTSLTSPITAALLGWLAAAGVSLAQEDMGGMFAPVPDAAMGPAVDQQMGYMSQELGDGLYWLTDGTYQTMFLTTGEGVIIVDAPPTMGQNLLNAVASVTDEPITHVIYSHSHGDHIGAASLYGPGVIIIAQQETARHLTAKQDPNRPVPTQVFDDSLTLTLGNQVLQLDYLGVNHNPGNIFIYAPKQKVLMLVDVVFPGWTPFPDLALAEDVEGFFAAQDQVLTYDFDNFIGGHLTRLGTRADVETQIEYFDDIVVAAGKANAAMDFGAAFGEAMERGGGNNIWAVVKIAFDRVARQCADEVEAKWMDRLGGVDVFTFDHCWKVSEFQRID
jgi:glyoxylase-like metal-dependent hydrolase (beta-lactamase superfamily II)